MKHFALPFEAFHQTPSLLQTVQFVRVKIEILLKFVEKKRVHGPTVALVERLGTCVNHEFILGTKVGKYQTYIIFITQSNRSA
jgi:hypothetical protein